VRPGSTFEFRTTAEKKLKTKARDWKGDPTNLGVLGSSTGGDVADLVAMRPRDPRYDAFRCPERLSWAQRWAYFVTSILPFMFGCSPQM
jgi:hypothetical protein